MHAPFAAPDAVPLAVPRRLILATALALGLAVSLAPRMPVAVAQESKAAGEEAAAAAAPQPKGGKGVVSVVKEAARKDGASVTDQTDPATGERTIVIRKGDKTVTISGVPDDKEIERHIESVTHKVDSEPAAIMIVGIVAIVFLAPVLAIALILGYRMRKLRLQNDTMVRLAEKGIVPPAEAIAAVTAGRPAEQFTAEARSPRDSRPVLPVIPPLPTEHVRYISKRTVWSDLRKGVLVGGAGLGLTLFSLLADRTPNSVGLVLLFVGVGYIVLWWLENRRLPPQAGGPGTPPGPGPDNAS